VISVAHTLSRTSLAGAHSMPAVLHRNGLMRTARDDTLLSSSKRTHALQVVPNVGGRDRKRLAINNSFMFLVWGGKGQVENVGFVLRLALTRPYGNNQI
jgi:hypothetical protein